MSEHQVGGKSNAGADHGSGVERQPAAAARGCGRNPLLLDNGSLGVQDPDGIWPNLHSLIMIGSQRRQGTGLPRRTAATPGHQAVRGSWRIQDNQHWFLTMALNLLLRRETTAKRQPDGWRNTFSRSRQTGIRLPWGSE